jgi:SAM-dependent MidA family methyltransferase
MRAGRGVEWLAGLQSYNFRRRKAAVLYNDVAVRLFNNLMGPGNLFEFIRAAIRRDGPVTFAWFMEQALYHPEFGYYSSGRARIGRRGDYFTNVSVGPLFGKILAAQFAEMWERMGRPDDFMVVEQGAHNGDFARDVLEAVRERWPDFFAAVRYGFVEPFTVLEAQQREVVRDFCEKATWWRSLDEMPPFSGVHFSNELLDSMPVRLVTRDDGGEWQEKFVAEEDGGFRFVAQPITDARLRERLKGVSGTGEGKYETEINLAALDWIGAVSAKLERGFVLAVDYGFSRSEFFASERTTGTLQGYASHRPVSSPLVDIGNADITAHVEWTSVAEQAEQCGLNIVGFTDQHHFMTGMLTATEPAADERRALQTLLHPEFLGTRFQYLALGKGAPASGLSGFRFARDPRNTLGL